MATLRDTFESLFSTDGSIPRPVCAIWPSWLVWEHVGGNALVWLAYVAIPVVIWRLERRLPKLGPFAGLMWAFTGFIGLCGLGHFLDMLAFFRPMYRLSGHVLIATGLASWWTAWSLKRAWPTLTALRSPAELEQVIAERTKELNRVIDDLKRAESDGARLATIVNSSDDAIIGKDLDGVITSWNASAERLYGYAAAEVIGRPITFLIPPDRPDEEADILARLRRGEQVDHFESVRATKDGRLIDVSMTISPIRDLSGRIIGISKIARDITERRRTEGTLRESETRFRQLADAMPQIVWTARPDGYLDYYNERWYEFTGLPRGGGGDASWKVVLHPDDVQACHDVWYHAVETGEPYQIEYRFKNHKTGEYRWHLGRALPVRDETGRVVRWFGTGTDIDDQKKTEAALRESEERQRLALSAARIGHWEWDIPSDSTTYHDSHSLLYGRPVNRPFEFFSEFLSAVHPDDRDHLRRAAERAMVPGAPYEAEFRMAWPDGTVHWLLTKGAVVRDKDGRPLRLTGVNMDITDRKEAEAEIRLLNEGLERRVMERTTELASAYGSLHESERRFRAIFDSSYQFSGLLSPDGTLLETNQTSLDRAGLTREQVVGLPFWNTLFWSFDASIQERLKAAVAAAAGGEFVRYEVDVPADGGEPITVDFSLKPVLGESGEVVLLLPEGRDITQRKRAEEALRLSEERFRGAFDAAASGMGLVSPEGRWLKVNASLCRIVGYSEAELLERSFQVITHPADLDLQLHKIRLLLAGELPSYQIEKRYIHKDGHDVRTILSASLVTDSNGHPLHFVHQVQDVTAWKLAEEARRLSESTIRSLFDSSPLMMGVVELEGDDIRHVSDNAATAAFVGLEVGAMSGRLDSELGVAAESRREWAGRFRDCAIDGRPIRFECVAGAAAGPRWLRATVAPIDDSTGPRPRFAYVAEDVTDRNADERTRTRLTTILETTSDFVGMADSQGRAQYINRAGREMIGLAPEADLGGIRIADTHPAWASEKVWNEGIPAALRDGIWRSETAFLTRDGREVPTSQVLIVKRAAGGEIDYIATIARDISAQRRTEEELRLARDQALAATRAKSGFLANMSHEIRTPMNGIVGMAELLLDTALDEQQHDYAATIRGSSEALLTIVNDILDLSKIEAGKIAIEAIGFRPRELIEEVSDLMAAPARQKGVNLCCFVPPSFPEHLVGDPHRLRQVLTNLVGNAVKFTDAGEVAIEALALGSDANRIHFRLLVRDTGIGIAAARREAVFESFSQAEDDSARRFGGTGLGLTICRHLAHMMGGEIGFESEPGLGSTFWLDLTLPEGDAFEGSLLAATGFAEGMNALLVDDSATNRRVVREYLHSFGCRTEEAVTAREALDLLRGRAGGPPFDVVFVDARVPGVHGEPLVRSIHREAGNAVFPLIVMGEGATAGRGARPEDSATVSRISKPLRRSQLLNVLMDAVEGRTKSETSEPSRSAPRSPIVVGPGLRVLVADDHATNRKVAARMLEALGCRVDLVCDGGAAVEAIARTHYDAVLMDIQMPVMDGLAATAEVRRRERGGAPRTTILAMTAHAMEGDRERCLERGMDGYVAKPIRHDDLRKALRLWSSPQEPLAVEPIAKADPDPTAAPFRWDTLVARFRGDEPFARLLAAAVLDTAPAAIRKIRAALAAGDAGRVVTAAHGLKGEALTIGANSLASALQRAELAGQANDLQSTASALARAEIHWQELSHQLQTRIGGTT